MKWDEFFQPTDKFIRRNKHLLSGQGIPGITSCTFFPPDFAPAANPPKQPHLSCPNPNPKRNQGQQLLAEGWHTGQGHHSFSCALHTGSVCAGARGNAAGAGGLPGLGGMAQGWSRSKIQLLMLRDGHYFLQIPAFLAH